MNVLIAGGSGLIGTALTASLLADGHEVSLLTRSPGRAGLPAGVHPVGWDGVTTAGWEQDFARADAVVNLVGESVGRWPWNKAQKDRILHSRLAAGRTLGQAFLQASRKPAVLVQASGVGYYGPLGPEPVTETARPGDDFMAGVAVQWEESSRAVEELPGVRRVVLRTALVLAARGGVLPQMALPVRLFAGGPLGNGRQGVSWIHIEDEVRAIRFLMDTAAAQGAYNLTSPQPVSNAAFMRELARALHRPYWLPAPGFALRLALGEMSTLLLDGQFALPARLQSLGFEFKHPGLAEALAALF